LSKPIYKTVRSRKEYPCEWCHTEKIAPGVLYVVVSGVVERGRPYRHRYCAKCICLACHSSKTCRPKCKRATSEQWYIRHSPSNSGRDVVLWWRENGAGYTVDIEDAGLYDREEAARIDGGRETDCAWPKDVVEKAVRRVVPTDLLFSAGRAARVSE
jgi:hypothetical protein